MPRLRRTGEQIFAKLREVEVALSKSQRLVQLWRTLGLTEHASS